MQKLTHLIWMPGLFFPYLSPPIAPMTKGEIQKTHLSLYGHSY